MLLYCYTCPECGLVVRLDHQSIQHTENKVCACSSEPVEEVVEAS
jgi:hypothetical protein